MTDRTQDRARGAMLGMAVGDALGAQIEFSVRDSHPLQTELTGGGPHGLMPGQWTDDTAMAVGLAEHLLVRPDVLAGALAGRWVSWYRHGTDSCTGTCFDIGNQTRSALELWERHIRGARPGAPVGIPGGEGNGSLMRVAPVAIRHWGDPTRAALAARLQSDVTHPAAGAGCATLTRILCDLIARGDPIGELHGSRVLDHWLAWADALVLDREDVSSSGWVRHTLEAAIWAVAGADDAEEAIVRAVNLGDDSDTVGAVAGALAGARWGAWALPGRWTDLVAWRGELVGLADRLWVAGAEDARMAA